MFSLGKSKPRKIWKFCPGDSKHFLLEGVFYSFSTPSHFQFPHTRGHLVTSSEVSGRRRPRHSEAGTG